MYMIRYKIYRWPSSARDHSDSCPETLSYINVEPKVDFISIFSSVSQHIGLERHEGEWMMTSFSICQILTSSEPAALTCLPSKLMSQTKTNCMLYVSALASWPVEVNAILDTLPCDVLWKNSAVPQVICWIS